MVRPPDASPYAGACVPSRRSSTTPARTGRPCSTRAFWPPRSARARRRRARRPSRTRSSLLALFLRGTGRRFAGLVGQQLRRGWLLAVRPPRPVTPAGRAPRPAIPGRGTDLHQQRGHGDDDQNARPEREHGADVDVRLLVRDVLVVHLLVGVVVGADGSVGVMRERLLEERIVERQQRRGCAGCARRGTPTRRSDPTGSAMSIQ